MSTADTKRPPLAVVILAAGLGTRMKSDVPKVLHEVCGRPMLSYVIDAALSVSPERVVVVTGPDQEAIAEILPVGCERAVQQERRGTGDAVRAGLEPLRRLRGRRHGAVRRRAAGRRRLRRRAPPAAPRHRRRRDAHDRRPRRSRALRAHRARRRRRRRAHRRVPRRDRRRSARSTRSTSASTCSAATPCARRSQRLGQRQRPGRAVPHRRRPPAARRRAHGRPASRATTRRCAWASTRASSSPSSTPPCAGACSSGSCSPASRWRIPETTYVDWGVEVGRDTLIRANTHLLGRTTVGAASEVGPGSFLRDAFVGDRARVISSHLYECVISSGCNVGPFAYIRPNTVLAEGAKAGTFVEIKNSRIGERSKVPHLSYVGDAIVGVDSNIAAGNITANYDGYDKHATHIGDRVRTGSDTTIVAPVTIGDDAFTAAGSVITRDVPKGALGVAREQQKNVDGYAERRAARRLREQRGRREPGALTGRAAGARFGTIVDRSAANTKREANGGGQHLLRDLAAQAAHDLLGAQQPRPRGEDRRQAGRPPRQRPAQDVLQRRDLRALRGERPRLRHVHRPVADGRHQRRAHGAAHHDPGGAAGLGQAHHRRHAVLPVLAAGQEERRPRAHHRAPRGHAARGRRASTGCCRWTCTRARSRGSSRSRSTT